MADYNGPARLSTGDEDFEVAVRLSGRLEPVDGRFHWGGRIAPDGRTAALVRNGVRAVSLRIGTGPTVQVRLSEVDPWGGVRLTAIGGPPWT